MALPILNQLKAEILLEGTPILEKVTRLHNSFNYKSTDEVYSYDDYYMKLLKETEKIEQIQLLSTVVPGTAQKYLVDLTQSLQLVTDKIESIHSRALFFAGKVRAAMRSREGLEAEFSVWYQIAVTEVLKAHDLKFSASVCKALAESEFTRLIGENVVLEGVEDAINMLIEHLKNAKKLAMEKYKLGTEQATVSIIHTPNQGLMEGEPFALLKSRYGSLSEDPPKPAYDDDEPEQPEQPMSPENQVSQYNPNGQSLPLKILNASIEKPEVAVVEEFDLEAHVAEWRKDCLDTALAVEDAVLMTILQAGSSTTEEEITELVLDPPNGHEIIHDDFVGDVKVVTKEDGTPGLVKETGQSETPHKAKSKPKYDDDDDIEVPEIATLAPETPATPQIVKKDRRKITFDDSF